MYVSTDDSAHILPPKLNFPIHLLFGTRLLPVVTLGVRNNAYVH